jgi:hypothetical protein
MLPKLLLAIALVLIAVGSAQADDSTFYEPPVEGGPQTSQGSGTR